MLNLVHVRSFLAVVDTGSFKQASRRVGCSQPSVSQQVRKLEAALGAPLVVRDRKRCRPTPKGKAFLPFARSLLLIADRARNAVGGDSLAVGASSNVGIYLLQPHLRSFRGSLGDAGRIDLWIGSNPEVADRIENREIDVAVMEWWDGRPGITAIPWRREPLVIIVPPGHPWAARGSVGREELLDTPLIGGETGSGTGRILRRAFGDESARLRVNLNLGSTEAVKQAVKSGLGISIVLASAVTDEVRAGSLRALGVRGLELEKEIFIMRRSDRPAADLGSHFIDHLIAATGRPDGRDELPAP